MLGNRNLLILVLLLVPMSFAFAEERDSGIRHVKCFDLQKSILETEETQISEFDYILLLHITQNDGECVMKNKLGRYYSVPWMPVYYTIQLIDMDFGTISSQRIITPNETQTIKFDLQNEIPYCIKVKSVWLDNRVRTESVSETCFKKLL